jgi:predicted phosphodiesterase
MQIAVISDMHGNNLAFETILNDINQKDINQIVCLGDAIQGGPRPIKVVQNLRVVEKIG